MGQGPRYPAERMIPLAMELRDILYGDVSICGSLARRRSTVGDIDLVLHHQDRDGAIEALVGNGLRVNVEHGSGPRTELLTNDGIKVDLWVGEPDQLESLLLHAVGSGIHNALMRRWARVTAELHVTWHGVHRISDNIRVDDGTQDGIRRLIDWPLLEPWEREIDPRDIPPWLQARLDILNAMEDQNQATTEPCPCPLPSNSNP